MAETVRVRFAPSPTGTFHIGSARTALFNWLYARRHGGRFILRIEDTDAQRNTEEALQALLEGMRWLGLDWDEGPEAGGDVGPYFQSQRADFYREAVERLRAAGRVYEKDGASWFRLEGERRMEFDAHKQCEVEKVASEPVVFEDLVRGRMERVEELDFVLLRSDGSPVFHLVNVVDDLRMGITHVIRGEDHLTNTFKHIHLFRALGAEPPHFAHLPLILKSTGKGKMSKRDEGALVEEYEQRGFLPAAVCNFLALLGWNPKDDEEIFALSELIERFDLDGVNKAGARFDEKKMAHFNTEHLRRLPVDELRVKVEPVLATAGIQVEDSAYLEAVLEIAREKMRDLEDLPDFLGFFFRDDYALDEKVRAKLEKKGPIVEKLEELLPTFKGWVTANTPLEEASCEAAVEALAEQKGRKKFDYFPALRYAVSGQGGGLDLLATLRVLGAVRVASRLSRTISQLS